MDSYTMVGHVLVRKHSIDDGRLLYEKTFKNQLTNYARTTAAALWTGSFPLTPTKIAVGTGAPTLPVTSTSATDTALWSELAGTRKTLDYATTFLQYYSQYAVTYDQTQAIGTITGGNPTGLITLTEAGLFDTSGNLFSHVIMTGVTHDTTSTLSIQWQILHNGN